MSEKTREFSFMVTTRNPGDEDPAPVQWACRFHPTDFWHEIGCPHCEWTKEQLQGALETAKRGHDLAVDYIRKALSVDITIAPDVLKLPPPEDFGKMFQVTTPVELLGDVIPHITMPELPSGALVPAITAKDPIYKLKPGHEPYMNLREVVQYEIHASFAGWIFAWLFGDLIAAKYFLWKTERKWARYQEHMEWNRERLRDQIERECT